MAQELPAHARKNFGLTEIEKYRGCTLPDEYEITDLLGDTIMAEFIDMAGDNLVRNGIVLPEGVADQKAWRVAKAVIVGPASTQVKVGDIIMFPGDRGLPGIKKDGKQVVFLNEERIFGICKKK